MNNHPLHLLRRCAGGRADRRGSAIILVLVSMVLMAILAGSLLQLARFERIPRSESNIEIVIESVIAEILNQVTDDLLDDNGKFLNTNFTATNGGGDEPWDFPWTNPSTAFGREAEFNDGTAVAVYGGAMDDSWLAAQMPDFRGTIPASSVYNGSNTNTTNGMWRKITNLTGLYLGGTAGSSNLSTLNIPNEYPVNATPQSPANLARDSNLGVTLDSLVDADGDGIGDSRWEWAPLRQIGATQYVMAVRIIDLSARMDMNVSTGRFVQTNTSIPRGDSPVEMNGQQFVEDAAVGAGTTAAAATNEWLSVLNFRLTSNANPGAVTPIGTTAETRYDNNNANPAPGTRRHLWTDGVSRVSNTFNFNGEDPGTTSDTFDYTNNTFGLTDAFELLRGNGVNSANTTTVENLMPNFLRQGGQEDNYAIGSINGWTERQFWELDPRKHVSMFTGSSVAARPYDTAQDRRLKIDVNQAVKSAAGRDALRDRIDAFLNATNGTALLPQFPQFTTVRQMSNQFTANIADYIDEDNRMTLVGNLTGFEALPYITEVYVQKPYEVSTVTTLGDGSKDVEWRGNGSVTGYAIEIGNPFGRYNGSTWVGRTISLENIWLKLGSAAAQNLVDDLSAPTTLAPGEVIIISHDSAPGGGGAARAEDDISELWAAPSGNATIAAGGNIDVTGTLTIPTGPVSVSLRAEDQDNPGTAMTWSYSVCDVEVATGPITENLPDDGSPEFTNIAAADTTFIQTNYRGVGEGLRMMTVHAGALSGDNRGYGDYVASLTAPSLNRDDATGLAVLDNVTPEFTSEAKSGATTQYGILDGQQIVWQDSPRNRMHWIGDILQIPVVGPDRTATGSATAMANAFGTAGMNASVNGITDLMLPYQRYSGPFAAAVINNNTSSAAGSGRFGIYNVPHALLLLEQLTTFNPATDGEDGDGQTDSGTESITNPDLDEVLVPGKINLNTASQTTLERLLPFPDLATRQAVAANIVGRREGATQASTYGNGADGIPGLAYTSLLFEQIENLAVNPSQIAGDTFEIGSPASRIDLNEHESPLGTYTGTSQDEVNNDREEELMLAKWLTEVADTRSDIFAAYIVVQGYPSDNFSNGADESARLIIIFSRANVEGAGDKAVEIGRFRIN